MHADFIRGEGLGSGSNGQGPVKEFDVISIGTRWDSGRRVVALALRFSGAAHFGLALDLKGVREAHVTPILAVAATHRHAKKEQMHYVCNSKSGASKCGRIAGRTIHGGLASGVVNGPD